MSRFKELKMAGGAERKMMSAWEADISVRCRIPVLAGFSQ